ncbi:MAG: hypothetical protein ACHQDY_06815 [Solirubrobacterales bacterium]
MLGRERIRELYHVYGEHEVPAHDDWSQSEQPTRELSELDPKPREEPRPERAPVRSGARAHTLRRVATMTLLGAGVGVVAALAQHSLSGSTGGKRRGGGGAAPFPTHAPAVPVAAAPPRAPAQRTISALSHSSGARRETSAHPPAHRARPNPAERLTVASRSASAIPAESSALAAAPAEGPPPAVQTSEFGFES